MKLFKRVGSWSQEIAYLLCGFIAFGLLIYVIADSASKRANSLSTLKIQVKQLSAEVETLQHKVIQSKAIKPLRSTKEEDKIGYAQQFAPSVKIVNPYQFQKLQRLLALRRAGMPLTAHEQWELLDMVMPLQSESIPQKEKELIMQIKEKKSHEH